jgi:hypothetical protein
MMKNEMMGLALIYGYLGYRTQRKMLAGLV